MEALRVVARFLLQPWLVLLFISGLGLLNLWRRRVESRRRLLLASVPLGLLMLLSTPVVNYFAVGTLEWAYDEPLGRPPNIEAIVVLGGYITPPTESQQAQLGLDSYIRCLHALSLYRVGPPCPVVVAGGKVDASDPGPTIAEVMGDYLRSNGIASADLILESNSRNTYENARNTKELLSTRGIRKVAVVTHAIHMRRAEGCFRLQGFDVEPSACSFHPSELSVAAFLPDPMAAASMSYVLHEWIGMAVYRLKGWL